MVIGMIMMMDGGGDDNDGIIIMAFDDVLPDRKMRSEERVNNRLTMPPDIPASDHSEPAQDRHQVQEPSGGSD